MRFSSLKLVLTASVLASATTAENSDVSVNVYGKSKIVLSRAENPFLAQQSPPISVIKGRDDIVMNLTPPSKKDTFVWELLGYYKAQKSGPYTFSIKDTKRATIQLGLKETTSLNFWDRLDGDTNEFGEKPVTYNLQEGVYYPIRVVHISGINKVPVLVSFDGVQSDVNDLISHMVQEKSDQVTNIVSNADSEVVLKDLSKLVPETKPDLSVLSENPTKQILDAALLPSNSKETDKSSQLPENQSQIETGEVSLEKPKDKKPVEGPIKVEKTSDSSQLKSDTDVNESFTKKEKDLQALGQEVKNTGPPTNGVDPAKGLPEVGAPIPDTSAVKNAETDAEKTAEKTTESSTEASTSDGESTSSKTETEVKSDSSTTTGAANIGESTTESSTESSSSTAPEASAKKVKRAEGDETTTSTSTTSTSTEAETTSSQTTEAKTTEAENTTSESTSESTSKSTTSSKTDSKDDSTSDSSPKSAYSSAPELSNSSPQYEKKGFHYTVRFVPESAVFDKVLANQNQMLPVQGGFINSTYSGIAAPVLEAPQTRELLGHFLAPLDGMYTVAFSDQVLAVAHIGPGSKTKQPQYTIDGSWQALDTRESMRGVLTLKSGLLYPFRIVVVEDKNWELSVVDPSGTAIDLFGLLSGPVTPAAVEETVKPLDAKEPVPERKDVVGSGVPGKEKTEEVIPETEPDTPVKDLAPATKETPSLQDPVKTSEKAIPGRFGNASLAQKPAGNSLEKPAEKTGEKTDEIIDERVSEKSAETTAKKTSEKNTEKDTERSKSPVSDGNNRIFLNATLHLSVCAPSCPCGSPYSPKLVYTGDLVATGPDGKDHVKCEGDSCKGQVSVAAKSGNASPGPYANPSNALTLEAFAKVEASVAGAPGQHSGEVSGDLLGDKPEKSSQPKDLKGSARTGPEKSEKSKTEPELMEKISLDSSPSAAEKTTGSVPESKGSRPTKDADDSRNPAGPKDGKDGNDGKGGKDGKDGRDGKDGKTAGPKDSQQPMDRASKENKPSQESRVASTPKQTSEPKAVPKIYEGSGSRIVLRYSWVSCLLLMLSI